ncbi:MAG TPA: glutaminyl-peptide cyclotransferase [Pyrinomonadaceae bacterium]|jgi:glutamine cyclotransferase
MRREFFRALLSAVLFVGLLACSGSSTATQTARGSEEPAADSPPVYTYQVVNTWPHDEAAYTQGLVFHDGELFESTGLRGQSSLRRVELKTGKVKKKVEVAREYFAEGMTIFRDRIFQLTWQSKKGFVYDLKKFKQEGEFAYEGEGWGLTHDGHSLILSDGTNRIRFLDPASFQVQRTISVFDQGQPLTELNELEYINGEIYANIWKSDRIVRIDPTTGKINAWVDMTGLHHQGNDATNENCLNGIAYDAEHDRLYVTGKRWPSLFEIKLMKK